MKNNRIYSLSKFYNISSESYITAELGAKNSKNQVYWPKYAYSKYNNKLLELINKYSNHKCIRAIQLSLVTI